MTPDAQKSMAAAAWALAASSALALQDEHAEDASHGAESHDAHAAAPGAIPSVQEGLITGITALIVFGIVYAVLHIKVWPMISKGLDERAAKIREEIAAAEDARKQAAAALASYQQSLAEARAEAHKLLEDARADQQKLAAELKVKADAELTEMRDKARRDIEAAKRAALSEIYADAANVATRIAAKILAREVRPSDHQRLVEESLNELEGAGAH